MDRSLVVAGLESVFLAIKQIVLASDLDREEKDDILSNIAGLPVVISNVVEAQGSNVYPRVVMDSEKVQEEAQEEFEEDRVQEELEEDPAE